jgi:hypothetical protein
VYYVYKHVDPASGEVLYVGHGCRSRAWTNGSERTPLRSQEHVAHLEDLTQVGYVASDWVHIVHSGLTKSAACEIERGLIDQLRPTYNKELGKKHLRITPEEFTAFKEMREDGMSYKAIADEFGYAAMTVYRALNGQTKNLEGKL